jgi:hypothetical protein
MSARAQGSSYRFLQEVPHNGPDIWFTDVGYGLMIHPSRLLKKAHLPRWRARAALRRTRKYASRLHPSCGWVPGAPPCIWTFLSSLGVNEFFSSLLGPDSGATGASLREVAPGRRDECKVYLHTENWRQTMPSSGCASPSTGRCRGWASGHSSIDWPLSWD